MLLSIHYLTSQHVNTILARALIQSLPLARLLNRMLVNVPVIKSVCPGVHHNFAQLNVRRAWNTGNVVRVAKLFVILKRIRVL